MPTLVVVLLLVSYTKEVHFLFVSLVLALFSWTSIARLVRIEMIKQKHLCYVQVLKNMEISRWRILFKHLLPNSYWSLLSLLPNALIGAITYESALSFLGLGDRSSCSLGLLLDEARMRYPFDPQIFWPPALLLIALLVPLTWVGDLLREKLDF
jgi:peptide/nickel transport system permease protein